MKNLDLVSAKDAWEIVRKLPQQKVTVCVIDSGAGRRANSPSNLPEDGLAGTCRGLQIQAPGRHALHSSPCDMPGTRFSPVESLQTCQTPHLGR